MRFTRETAERARARFRLIQRMMFCRAARYRASPARKEFWVVQKLSAHRLENRQMQDRQSLVSDFFGRSAQPLAEFCSTPFRRAAVETSRAWNGTDNRFGSRSVLWRSR